MRNADSVGVLVPPSGFNLRIGELTQNLPPSIASEAQYAKEVSIASDFTLKTSCLKASFLYTQWSSDCSVKVFKAKSYISKGECECFHQSMHEGSHIPTNTYNEGLLTSQLACLKHSKTFLISANAELPWLEPSSGWGSFRLLEDAISLQKQALKNTTPTCSDLNNTLIFEKCILVTSQTETLHSTSPTVVDPKRLLGVEPFGAAPRCSRWYNHLRRRHVKDA